MNESTETIRLRQRLDQADRMEAHLIAIFRGPCTCEIVEDCDECGEVIEDRAWPCFGHGRNCAACIAEDALWTHGGSRLVRERLTDIDRETLRIHKVRLAEPIYFASGGNAA